MTLEDLNTLLHRQFPEDAAQQALLNVWKKWGGPDGTLRSGAPDSGGLLRYARRTARTFVLSGWEDEARYREILGEASRQGPPPASSPLHRAESRETLGRVASVAPELVRESLGLQRPLPKVMRWKAREKLEAIRGAAGRTRPQTRSR